MVEKVINYFLAESFIECIVSDKEKCNKSDINKIVIKKISTKSLIGYQLASYNKTQVKHQNITNEEFEKKLEELLCLYRQLLIKTSNNTVHAIKNGNKLKVAVEEKQNTAIASNSNNRQKNYILNDGDQLDFLVEQGVMSSNYRVKSDMQHKFRQINRYLEFVRDVQDELPNDRPINIIDFGCGKSYLTFAVYHYLKNILHKDVYIHGLDLKQEVINNCNRLAIKLGYDNLNFEIGDIADFKSDKPIDMVMTLHACDTATDFALFNAIGWNTKIILSAPCCQHEVNKQMGKNDLDSIFKYGIIKERASALFTDSLRANILEIQGYKTQILEFIDIEDTPKNLLIRAVKVGKPTNNWAKVDALVDFFKISPTLYRLLRGNRDE